jgi:hypothetical protein
MQRMLSLALAALVTVGHAASALADTSRPVAAQFSFTASDAAGKERTPAEFHLWRTADRVETDHDGRAVVWQRDTEGTRLTRVFHADSRMVEYSPGELKAMRIEPRWEALASMLDPADLSGLPAAGSTEVFGQVASIREGVIGEEQVTVWWIDALSIPARYERTGPNGRVRFTLESLADSAPSGWPLVSDAAWREYVRIDAADLGEMEDDAFVRKLQRMDAGSRFGHGHHGHEHR